MAVTVELPHVGESVVEGTISKWLKQPGESVRRYEPLVEIVTDKVTMEVPSPVAGELLRVLAEEGETLPMGAPIAEVGEPGEAPGQSAPPAAAPAAEALAPAAPATSYLMQSVTPVGPTGGAAVEAMEPMVGIDAVAQASAAPPPAPAHAAPAQTETAPVPAPASTAVSPATAGSTDGRQRLSPPSVASPASTP